MLHTTHPSSPSPAGVPIVARPRRTAATLLPTLVLALAALVALAALPAPAAAQALPLDVAVEFDRATGRAARLVVEGAAPFDGWLGRSLYPKDPAAAASGADHRLTAVGRGAIRSTWPIPESCAEGSFEVALWTKRVDKSKCTVKGCAACAARGYHLEGLVAYRSGRLGSAAAPAPRFACEAVRETGGDRFVVSGEAPSAGAWLGRSLYPKNVKDLAKEGKHETVARPGGKLDQSVALGAEWAGGTYEVALWGRRVEAKNCPVASCGYCAAQGFHLEELLAYQTGSLDPVYLATLEVSLRRSPRGAPVAIEVSGRVRNGAGFLGRSLFRPGTQDGLAEGDHVLVELPGGTFRQSWPINPAFTGGGYEVALWYAKVDRARCRIANCKYCAAQGHHLEGLVTYKSGRLTMEGR
ncbi:MAG: hypothetical protein HZA54_08815 [Planctomycetes bacterium]|nr:hypothetical protein [Planctomycetota bacterium]